MGRNCSELVRRVGRAVVKACAEPRWYDDADEAVAKRSIFDELVMACVDNDCDTLDECRGIDPELDAAIDAHWGKADYHWQEHTED